MARLGSAPGYPHGAAGRRPPRRRGHQSPRRRGGGDAIVAPRVDATVDAHDRYPTRPAGNESGRRVYLCGGRARSLAMIPRAAVSVARGRRGGHGSRRLPRKHKPPKHGGAGLTRTDSDGGSKWRLRRVCHNQVVGSRARTFPPRPSSSSNSIAPLPWVLGPRAPGTARPPPQPPSATPPRNPTHRPHQRLHVRDLVVTWTAGASVPPDVRNGTRLN